MNSILKIVQKQICNETRNTKIINLIVSNTKYATKSEATFEVPAFKLHLLKDGPATETVLTATDALKIYENLQVLRRMETAAADLYKDKLIRGFCHLYIGQEAVAVGINSAMRKQDTCITSYRCHGWTYLLGVSVLGVLAELTSRTSGCSRGKGGSMHMYARNFFGGNGIVGAQVPLGAGAAFASKYKGDGGVCFSMYGDGASNQGQVFEAYNISKLWNLPAVFVCENNLYGMGTKSERSSASTKYYTRGDYIPGVWVDGMDVLAAREAARFCIEYCTSEKGPLVIEMQTYRYMGHSMSDPGTSYRKRDEVQKMRSTRDPINNFKEKIIKAELVTAEQLKEIESKVKADVAKAAEQSKTDPDLGVDEIGADIYKLCLYPNNLVRGIHPGSPLKHFNVRK